MSLSSNSTQFKSSNDYPFSFNHTDSNLKIIPNNTYPFTFNSNEPTINSQNQKDIDRSDIKKDIDKSDIKKDIDKSDIK